MGKKKVIKVLRAGKAMQTFAFNFAFKIFWTMHFYCYLVVKFINLNS